MEDMENTAIAETIERDAMLLFGEVRPIRNGGRHRLFRERLTRSWDRRDTGSKTENGYVVASAAGFGRLYGMYGLYRLLITDRAGEFPI